MLKLRVLSVCGVPLSGPRLRWEANQGRIDQTFGLSPGRVSSGQSQYSGACLLPPHFSSWYLQEPRPWGRGSQGSVGKNEYLLHRTVRVLGFPCWRPVYVYAKVGILVSFSTELYSRTFPLDHDYLSGLVQQKPYLQGLWQLPREGRNPVLTSSCSSPQSPKLTPFC